jgi:hypothetical protein
VVADVSEPYARVIDRALEFRREHRYEGAAEMKDDVRKAIAEIQAGTAPTRLAVRGGAAEDSDGREPTTLAMENRRPEAPARRAPTAASETSEASTSAADASAGEASASAVKKPPRRRSFLMWVTLLVFAVIGGRLWLDAHPDQSPSAKPEVAAPSAAPSSEAIPPLPSASTAESPTPTASAASAASVASAAPTPSGATGSTGPLPPLPATPPSPPPAVAHSTAPAHTAPTKAGPANVHKLLPRKRRTTGSPSR